MATTTDYLNQIIAQKKALAENLKSKGIEASDSEKLNTLVPKVLDIPSGGSNLLKGANWEKGYITTSGGLDEANAQEMTSDYIDIKVGIILYFSSYVNNTSAKWFAIGEYDGEGIFQKRTVLTTNDKYGILQLTTTYPKVKVSLRTYGLECPTSLLTINDTENVVYPME